MLIALETDRGVLSLTREYKIATTRLVKVSSRLGSSQARRAKMNATAPSSPDAALALLASELHTAYVMSATRSVAVMADNVIAKLRCQMPRFGSSR